MVIASFSFPDVYGMRVTNCVVRDGLNWGEQPLINNEGYVDPHYYITIVLKIKGTHVKGT